MKFATSGRGREGEEFLQSEETKGEKGETERAEGGGEGGGWENGKKINRKDRMKIKMRKKETDLLTEYFPGT